MGTHSTRSRTSHTRWWSLALLCVIVAAATLVAAGTALAAPPPTLSLDDLQAELTAHGTVDGFMKTSMSGTTVSTIPVRILAIVDGFYWGKLIMFESTDPVITDLGGIAAGMSGSPVYVNVGGTDRIVGAVSYGDWFTLRGTGLATPIEYMTALQAKYGAAASSAAKAATAVKLDAPVSTSMGAVRKLVLGDAASATTAAADTAVMHPLAVATITGLTSGTSAYAKVAAKLEGSGLTVLKGEAAGTATATPALQEGSPCGISFATGRYAISVLGTVTYVDGDDVLLFGHPILGGYSNYDLGLGAIKGTLTGATVDAVWPSTYEPYKMMTPADVKGVATQDRSSGVVAKLGGSAQTFPVTTHAIVNGGAVVTDVTALGEWFATTYYPEILSYGSEESGATTYVAAAGLYHALDSDPLQGSATTTTTVVVNDGTRDYTFTRSNIWDNNSDDSYAGLADAAASDVSTIMANVLSDPYNVRDVEIKSVDVTADFASARRYGGITDATIGRAIRWGANKVDVTYYNTGSTAAQTLAATLDVPKGTSLSGTLMAMSAASWNDYYGDYSDYESSASAPLTLTQTGEIIDAVPTNEDVVVAYIPSSSEDEDMWSGPTPAAETTVSGDYVFSGGVEKATAEVVARVRGAVESGAPIQISGYVRDAPDGVPVSLYCQEAGRPEPTKPTAVVKARDADDYAAFAAVLPGFKHNVLITAETAALADDSLPGADQLTVKVRAKTRLTAKRSGTRLTLTARVSPADASGKVVFQRKIHGRWVAGDSATLTKGVARVKVSGGGVSAVRARFAGGDTNAASAWATRALH